MSPTIIRILIGASIVLAVQQTNAGEFTIQLANSVAAQNYQMKRSAFVFRTDGCVAPDKPDVMAKAEGKVSGNRRSLPLKVVASPTPGVYGVFREWPEEGVWIVNLTARCGQAIAGALVATDGKVFIRESSTILKHAATEPEIETALKKAPRQ
ncbi:MAG TPA: hypothetical protein VEX68_07280 [Bryobacteraceae bacterium]|nr:hypothetical protein [Bryobacteraceae bacterium]